MKVWLDAKNAPVDGDVLAAWGDALLDTERCRCEPVKVGDVADIVVQRERVLRFAARVAEATGSRPDVAVIKGEPYRIP